MTKVMEDCRKAGQKESFPLLRPETRGTNEWATMEPPSGDRFAGTVRPVCLRSRPDDWRGKNIVRDFARIWRVCPAIPKPVT